MLLSVVIPTCERVERLAQCLERLAPGAQTLDAAAYEVLVTDDSSTSSARDRLESRFPWVRWTSGPRRGPAANRNNGAGQAGGEWVVFTDDDCLPERGWLSAFQSAMHEQPSCNVFEGCTLADRPRRSLGESAPVNETGGYLWSCNFAVRRNLFLAMNGFDERFPYACMEDVDFRYRLARRGERFSFVSKAAVCHPWRMVNVLREHEIYDISLGVYLRIHPEQRHEFSRFRMLKAVARTFVRGTLPGIWAYRGAGLQSDLLKTVLSIRTAVARGAKYQKN